MIRNKEHLPEEIMAYLDAHCLNDDIVDLLMRAASWIVTLEVKLAIAQEKAAA